MRVSYPAVFVLCTLLVVGGCKNGGGGGGGNPGEPTATSTATDAASPTPTADPNAVFRLEGDILPVSGSNVDGDVNDVNAAYRDNDTIDRAQRILNPVTLGGYVNQAGFGVAGRSRETGDVLDRYAVSLKANQVISLFIGGDGLANDVDLFLVDLNDEVVDESLGTGKFEALSVPVDGEYQVVVGSYSGASAYVLTIGQSAAGNAAGALRLSDDFAPGEAVVRFREQIAPAAVGLASRARSVGLTAKAGAEGRNMLLSLDGVDHAAFNRARGGGGAAHQLNRFADATLELKRDTLLAVKSLRGRADVLHADPNYRRSAQFVPDDPFFPLQWHYPLINLPEAWDASTGQDAIIGVIDTGVVPIHPDLQGQLVAGYDFISEPENALDFDGIDPDPSDPGDRTNPDGSSSFHGTHVAGTVAAATSNGIGVAGVAFAGRVMPLRVLGAKGGYDYDIEQALRFAAGLPNDSGTTPARRADAVNLSLGRVGGFSASSEAVYREVHDAGVVIVAAAGNESTSSLGYPASYDGVVSVSAVAIDSALAPYSNFGTAVDVAAPGGDLGRDVDGDGNADGVLSTLATDAGGLNYVFYQGTSMAAPHVAGVVALMRAANPNLTSQDVDDLLASGRITIPLGPPGRDDFFGHGLIDANAAVTVAREEGGNPLPQEPVLGTSPAALNFGLTEIERTLTVSNSGRGALSVTNVTQDSGGWLSVSTPGSADGLGNYRFEVSRSSLSAGVYTATVTFFSTANTVQVSVIMQVGSADESEAELGTLYVILIDPGTSESLFTTIAARQPNGRYAYAFPDAPSGRYVVAAGTDLDNDDFICDAGEACGAYLTFDGPTEVDLNENRSGIDFSATFSTRLEDFAEASAQSASGFLGFSRRVTGKQLEQR